jgi:hypothetical protein
VEKIMLGCKLTRGKQEDNALLSGFAASKQVNKLGGRAWQRNEESPNDVMRVNHQIGPQTLGFAPKRSKSVQVPYILMRIIFSTALIRG